MAENRFRSFREFYPYQLKEHSRLVYPGLHYVGSVLAIVMLAEFLTGRTRQKGK